MFLYISLHLFISCIVLHCFYYEIVSKLQTHTKPHILTSAWMFIQCYTVTEITLPESVFFFFFFTITICYLKCRYGVITKTDYVAFPYTVTLNLYERKNIKKTASVKVQGRPLTTWQLGGLWKQTDRVRCTYQM